MYTCVYVVYECECECEYVCVSVCVSVCVCVGGGTRKCMGVIRYTPIPHTIAFVYRNMCIMIKTCSGPLFFMLCPSYRTRPPSICYLTGEILVCSSERFLFHYS